MPTVWDMDLLWHMVRDQYSAVTERQRKLQSEQENIRPTLTRLRSALLKIATSVSTVESVGGDASALRVQMADLERQISPLAARFQWLEGITRRLADCLVHLGGANEHVFCLNISESHLERFERENPEPLATD